jgi:RimJ/RimL family protein N-acetyltransferase
MRLAPPTPTLDDGIVALRPLSEGDRAGVARVFVTPDWVRWFGPGHDAAIHIECASRCWTDGSEAWFTICEAGNAGYCGEVALRPEGDRRRANLEYWLVPEMCGRGFATRAVNLVTAWAFPELGIARVQLWTEPDNLASQRVAVASGFTREGLRHYDEIDGQRVDSVFFSRLPGDTSATRPRTL